MGLWDVKFIISDLSKLPPGPLKCISPHINVRGFKLIGHSTLSKCDLECRSRSVNQLRLLGRPFFPDSIFEVGSYKENV